jgi:hypothetical protein
LPVFEKKYPNDKRPRKAIQTAKRWLRTGSKKGLRAAVYDGYTTYAGYAAANVAGHAAGYAADAADAASAADAACAANATDATDATAIVKIRKYFMKLVKEKMRGK